GVPVGPAVLLRALEERPDLFRVLDPWRGPWRSGGRGPLSVRAGGAAARWVVPLGRATLDRDPQARLKASVVHLGRTLDERSVTDLARWLGMVREMARYGRRSNHPERHSPSASTSTSAKPA